MNPVHDLAVDLLAALVARYATEAVAVPARQLVNAGPPADDCEQITVSWGFTPGVAASIGRDLGLPIVCGTPLAPTLYVRVTRCVPVGDGTIPPDAATMQAAASSLHQDLWVIHRTLTLDRDAFVDCEDVRPLAYGIDGEGDFRGAWCEIAFTLAR